MMLGRMKKLENEKKNFIADHALLTEENFMLAAQVEKSFEEIMNRLVGKLLSKLTEELTEILGSEWEIGNYFNEDAFSKHWNFVIWKKKWEYNADGVYWFGFTPDKTRLGDFHFYAMRDSEVMTKPLNAVNQTLNDHYKKGRKDTNIDWWQYVDHDYLNWTHDDTLVKLYRQDEMINYLTEQFIKMKDIIEPIVDAEFEKYSKG